MKTIKLTIEYDGTCFHGWQIQKGLRTVQGEVEKALNKIFKKRMRVYGSGRTDAGVHASGQVAHFAVNSQMSVQEMLKAINANIPDDIVIHRVDEAKSTFHAQYKAKSKVYAYNILNRTTPSVQQRNFYYFYPYDLNLKNMRQEAKALIGKKDFKSFQAADAHNKKRSQNTIRKIKSIQIKKKGSYVTIQIEANGFLYKMVRNIVSALLEIGTGRLPMGSIKKILKQKNRVFAPKTAPAKGLCLVKVKY